MGLLDSMVERGRIEGLAKGEAKGRTEGQRAMLRKQLQLRFGVLAADTVAALEAMDLAALDAASERVLTASRLDDVLAAR